MCGKVQDFGRTKIINNDKIENYPILIHIMKNITNMVLALFSIGL